MQSCIYFYMVCIWRPVSSQQTSSMTDKRPMEAGQCPFTAASVRLFPGSDRTLSPGISRPLVCVHWFCLSSQLVLLFPWLDLDCLSLHSTILQAEAGVGLDACLPLDVFVSCRCRPGPSLLSCLYRRTEPRSRLQVTRSNGTGHAVVAR